MIDVGFYEKKGNKVLSRVNDILSLRMNIRCTAYEWSIASYWTQGLHWLSLNAGVRLALTQLLLYMYIIYHGRLGYGLHYKYWYPPIANVMWSFFLCFKLIIEFLLHHSFALWNREKVFLAYCGKNVVWEPENACFRHQNAVAFPLDKSCPWKKGSSHPFPPTSSLIYS